MSRFHRKTNSLDLESRLCAAHMMITSLERDKAEILGALTALNKKHSNLISSAQNHIGEYDIICDCGEITNRSFFCACLNMVVCSHCFSDFDADDLINCSRCLDKIYFCNSDMCQDLKRERTCSNCKN